MEYTTAVGFFPTMKLGQIQTSLAQCGIDISMDELQEPSHHKEKLRKIFLCVVRIFDDETFYQK
jgi:hypothetical protein